MCKILCHMTFDTIPTLPTSSSPAIETISRQLHHHNPELPASWPPTPSLSLVSHPIHHPDWSCFLFLFWVKFTNVRVQCKAKITNDGTRPSDCGDGSKVVGSRVQHPNHTLQKTKWTRSQDYETRHLSAPYQSPYLTPPTNLTFESQPHVW